jgi:solute carrier family 13 (sodium-dependent dicarboxylate transporter), member 2/3/5
MHKRFGILGGFLVFFLIALLPLDPVTVPVPARLAAAVTGLMLAWWITEAIPIYATALVPLVLFPVLGILSPQDAAVSYADQTVFLFMGGFLIAAAMMRWNLHRRIALNVISRAGSGTRTLLLGFMIATAFISMWISNTATAMMMIPIALALVSTLMPEALSGNNGEEGGRREFATCLLLGVGYAATIGGMATLIGTPPNGILVAQLSSIFPAAPGIDFFSWMIFAVPFMVLFLLIAWFWLSSVMYRHLPHEIPGSRDLIVRELDDLGPLTPGEKWTLLVFLSVAVAWICRTPKVIGPLALPGITTFIPGVTDATIAIGGALVLFLLPVDAGKGVFTLTWESARGIPWGVLILFGGGICLSAGIIASGLADLIAGSFILLKAYPLFVIILLITLFITFLNEVVSNTAMASIMVPLVAISSVSMGINPMMLMIPVALASSLGFMLPVGTPPNTIAYSTGYISTREMARAGFALNVIGCILITLFMAFVIPAILGISPDLPAWAVIAGK